MKTQARPTNVPWLVAGAVFMALLLVVVWHFHQDESPTARLAAKADRVDLVGRMQLDLAFASEAEKSAVLAVTDEASRTFANQARAATANVAREHQELSTFLTTGASQRERQLLVQFAGAFTNLQRIDEDVLALAVKNTNLKAYALLFGPAADRLAQMDTALDRVVTKSATWPETKQVMLMAFGARLGILRIQALLAPHIAEESDAKMDRMEAAMAKEETQIHKDLDGLVTLPKLSGDADLGTAVSRFASYGELKAQILVFSRENTNVRSLTLSLNQKRKALAVCLDTLASLKQAILDEPIPGVTYGRPAKPR